MLAYSGLGEEQREIKQIPDCFEYGNSSTLTMILFLEKRFAKVFHEITQIARVMTKCHPSRLWGPFENVKSFSVIYEIFFGVMYNLYISINCITPVYNMIQGE